MRSVAAVALVVALATAIPARANDAGHGPVQVDGDYYGGTVTTRVTAPGSSGAAAPARTESGSAKNDLRCTWTEIGAYAQELYQNFLSWGEVGGRWYDVRCSDGSLSLSVYVPPASGKVPPAVVLAGSLASSAANRLPLPAPQVEHNPSGQTLTDLPTWFWVPPSQWSALTQRTQAGPVFAVVTARPVSTTWDPGDGSVPVVCAGPGTPYDRSRPDSAQSTDCSYTYPRTSADQPQTGPDPNDRFFTVTVTTTWAISWAGSGGSGGTLPAMQRRSSFPLAVAARQTVVTGGSG